MKKKISSKMTVDYLQKNARYLDIVIPYYGDDDGHLITFSDGFMTELEYDEEFVNPMLDAENKQLKLLIDLQTLKVVEWDGGNLRMWGKVRDGGAYTLLDADKHPIWQIQGYVPNKLLPPYETGWGDYLEFIIIPDGSLQEWRTPMDFTDFIKDGHEPKPIKTNKWYRAKGALWQVHSCSLNNEEMAWLIDRLTEEQNSKAE